MKAVVTSFGMRGATFDQRSGARARLREQLPVLRAGPERPVQPGHAQLHALEGLDHIGEVRGHEPGEVVERLPKRRTASTQRGALEAEHVGDLVVQAEARERHVVTADEQRALRLPEAKEQLRVERAADLHGDERVVTAGATWPQFLDGERLGASGRVDHQHVVRAARRHEPPEDHLLVEREVAAIRRDAGLHSAARQQGAADPP